MEKQKLKVSFETDSSTLLPVLKKFNGIEVIEGPDKESDYTLTGQNESGVDLLLASLAEEIDYLFHNRDVAEELQAILRSAFEGIEAVDIHGNIKYVNPAFLNITLIKEEDRKGHNIYEKNPEGLLAQVLKNRTPLYRVKTRAPGSGADVIASATPVYRNTQMIGAVIVVSDISETIKIAKELEKSRYFLDTMYDRMGDANQTFDKMIGISKDFVKTVEQAKQYGNSNSNVLLLGESGTGKELFAQAIHNHNPNKKRAFISVNCASIPYNLLESELFGHEKGAFTGADKKRIGMFELAENGTIFLDEIGDLDYSLQGKLLRVLQEREFRRVGGNKIIKTNARVITATNRPLEQMIKEENNNKFRPDLYYRLNVLQLRIPPLCKRLEDIPQLVEHFVEKYNRKLNKTVSEVDYGFIEALTKYCWPGNIRELENVLERAVNIAEGPILTEETLSLPFSTNDSKDKMTEEPIPSIVQMEKMLMQRALALYGNSFEGKQKAAKHLGISIAKLYNKLKEINLESGGDGLDT
jgi:PAS domain S-box-containing protein